MTSIPAIAVDRLVKVYKTVTAHRRHFVFA